MFNNVSLVIYMSWINLLDFQLYIILHVLCLSSLLISGLFWTVINFKGRCDIGRRVWTPYWISQFALTFSNQWIDVGLFFLVNTILTILQNTVGHLLVFSCTLYVLLSPYLWFFLFWLLDCFCCMNCWVLNFVLFCFNFGDDISIR